MKNNNTTHAGCPGSRAGVEAERTNKVIKPIIFTNQIMFDMSNEILDSYMEQLTTYAELHGVEREVVDAIFRTSILIGLRTAEAELDKLEGSFDSTNKF